MPAPALRSTPCLLALLLVAQCASPRLLPTEDAYRFAAWSPESATQARGNADGAATALLRDVFGTGTPRLHRPERLPLHFPAHHTQGLVVTDTAFFITAVDLWRRRGWLFRVRRDTGRPTQRVDLTEAARIHPGGLSFDGRWLWVPNATYDRHGATRILALRPDDLRVAHSFVVPHHVSLVAADGQGRLYGTDWNSKHFYVWDHAGNLLERVASPTGVAYQDCQVVAEHLLCGGYRNPYRGMIDLIDPVRWRLVHRINAGRTAAGLLLTREGLAFHDDRLYLLPGDGHLADVLAFRLAG